MVDLLRRYVRLPLWCILLPGCDLSEDLQVTKKQLTITEIRLALAAAQASNNLITRIDSTDAFYRVSLEQGKSIDIQHQTMRQISFDSTHWLITFLFDDETRQAAHFVGPLKLDNDNVKINPYLTSPLTALVTFSTPVEGKFKVVVKAKDPSGISIAKTFGKIGRQHELAILGLYGNHVNEIEFTFLNAMGEVRCSKTVFLKTAPIKDGPALEIEVLRNALPHSYDGLYMVSNVSAGFDQTAELRWVYLKDRSSFFGKLRNGNFIATDPTQERFYEVTMLGQPVRTYVVPNGLHHEIHEMPNGNFLVGTYSPPGPPFADRLVEISRTTGAVVKEWDLKTILDPSRSTLPDVQIEDWLHINAAYYDERDQSIVVSGRSQCVVAKFDYHSGAVRWILANHRGWKPSLRPYLLKPVDPEGNPIDTNAMDFWTYGQHSIHRVPSGNLLLYDNGDYRGFYDNAQAPAQSYTRIVEYKIDEQAMTVQLVWEFDNDKTLFTRFTGATQFLGDTRLAGYMALSEQTPRIIEVDTTGKVLYDATINRSKAFYYRASKVDVYEGIE